MGPATSDSRLTSKGNNMRPTVIALMRFACLFCAVVADAQLQAAAGKVDITPSRPVYLAGYSSNRMSAGVNDPLWARCLVLKSGSETVALVSCDLLGLTRFNTEKI